MEHILSFVTLCGVVPGPAWRTTGGVSDELQAFLHLADAAEERSAHEKMENSNDARQGDARVPRHDHIYPPPLLHAVHGLPCYTHDIYSVSSLCALNFIISRTVTF